MTTTTTMMIRYKLPLTRIHSSPPTLFLFPPSPCLRSTPTPGSASEIDVIVQILVTDLGVCREE